MIRFETPDEIHNQLRSRGIDPDRDAREVYLVALHRRGDLTRDQVAAVLGLSGPDLDRLLEDD